MQRCNYSSVYHKQWNKMASVFFWGGRARHRLLQKMIEGCTLLINTIPELMEHTKLLTWLFLSLLHLAQS